MGQAGALLGTQLKSSIMIYRHIHFFPLLADAGVPFIVTEDIINLFGDYVKTGTHSFLFPTNFKRQVSRIIYGADKDVLIQDKDGFVGVDGYPELMTALHYTYWEGKVEEELEAHKSLFFVTRLNSQVDEEGNVLPGGRIYETRGNPIKPHVIKMRAYQFSKQAELAL